MQNEILQEKLAAAIGLSPEGDAKAHDTAGPRVGASRAQGGYLHLGNREGVASRTPDLEPFVLPTRSDDTVEHILATRQNTHGDFTDNARVMQGLKRVLWNEKGWDRLTDVQREALEMILHKCGRIISGNPNEPDHWNDIAGYAKLAAMRLLL